MEHKRFGLIIYKKELEDKFEKILNENLNIYKFKNKDVTLGHSTKRKGWIIFQIYGNGFKTYSEFDNFLLNISNQTSEEEGILVIGHNDKDNFMWLDYDPLLLNEIIEEYSTIENKRNEVEDA